MNWTNVRSTCAITMLLLLATPLVQAEYALNMRQGVTPISREVFGLHMIILWICVVIGTLVFGVMTYSIIRHRRSRGSVAARFSENLPLEITWTLAASLILVAMAVPATKTLIAMEDPSNPDLTIQVTGYQWKWHYRYLDDEIDFFSVLSTDREQINNRAPKGEHYLLEVDQPLVVPIRKKIRFLLGSNDVIHSWWLPDLGWKRDAIPGYINESWTWIEEPGTYRGQCAELCGRDHGFMPIVVVAKTEDEYLQWVADQKAIRQEEETLAESTLDMSQLMARGEEVYNKACVACHQPEGVGVPNVFPPLKGSSIATGPLDAHLDIVMNGKAGTAMQAFAGQLSDLDLAAVITFERNAFGNETGDIVQPALIKAAR